LQEAATATGRIRLSMAVLAGYLAVTGMVTVRTFRWQ
jgi:hypothetical protein